MLDIQRDVDSQGQTVLAVSGDIDLATAPRLGEALTEARQAGATATVVDLTGVDFMDSAGIRVLMEAARQTTGSLSVRGAHGWVARVLDLTGASDFLRVGTDPPPDSGSAAGGVAVRGDG
jgi:anti-sigma B factor antagonist